MISRPGNIYNLGLLGFDEGTWIKGITSNQNMVRSAAALVYARKRVRRGDIAAVDGVVVGQLAAGVQEDGGLVGKVIEPGVAKTLVGSGWW